MNNGTKKSYDELKETHIADHQGLFDRVSLDWENSAHQYRRTSLWMNIEMEIIRIIWKCWHFNMDVI